MRSLFLAALLPCLYWDQAPGTMNPLKFERVCAPRDQVQAWHASGIKAHAFDVAHASKLPVPGVQYRMDVASATHVPWIDANGWRFIRDPRRQYYYDMPRGKAALAAFEAFAYGADAVIHPDPQDLVEFARVMIFLKGLDDRILPPVADIGIVDDGSAQTGEVFNLLSRRNLLFQIIQAPDPKYTLNVRIGGPDYPKAEAANPAAFASLIRQKLGDEKRSMRLYGSDVVIGRLTGNSARAQLHLINYSDHKVEGLRARVRGEYPHGTLAAFGISNTTLVDYAEAGGATEFTVPEMGVYAIVDLKR